MKYDTAVRGETARRIEEIGQADILVGIPCYNTEETIGHVIRMVSEGLAVHYGDRRSVILVADGGSTDDTRETASGPQIRSRQERIVSIYRGPAGKGTALRSVFEAADRLHVQACVTVDSDLQSITPDWMKYLLDPVLAGGYQYVAPLYVRHKYDGTITNNVVYNLTRALYGKRIRQPIGGDFAISGEVARFYTGQDVWQTDVARYGIDIWMTTTAVTGGFRVCQSNLGVKIHDVKDPGQHLGPMFRQVLSALLTLMEQYEDTWKAVKGSQPLETFDYQGAQEPEPVQVNLPGMIEKFRAGHIQFSAVWGRIFCQDTLRQIAKVAAAGPAQFHLPTELWVKILYELAAAFHTWPGDRGALLETMIPLYLARVASFVRQSWEMTSQEAEALVEEQAEMFEARKDYLIHVWDNKSAGKAGAG